MTRSCVPLCVELRRQSKLQSVVRELDQRNRKIAGKCYHESIARDPYTLQRIAGHSSILISSRYVHPTPERLEDAFARLETYNQGKGVPIPEMSAAPVN
jgi:hypothetical protein